MNFFSLADFALPLLLLFILCFFVVLVMVVQNDGSSGAVGQINTEMRMSACTADPKPVKHQKYGRLLTRTRYA